MKRIIMIMVLTLMTGCSDSSNDGTENQSPVRGIVDDNCGSVRMTHYSSGESGWCGFRTSHDILPVFVRDKFTAAIGEPWNISSYEGESGEACGECWEIDSIYGTQVVMITDLCPIEGNPVCAGGHFHFDLSAESAAILHDGEASARRFPCPVTGNIHIEINDRNQWGYVSLAFFNHRYPIRNAEYRAADGTEWIPLSREGGTWRIRDDNYTFSDNGPGGVFRLTCANGEVVEGSSILSYDYADEEIFDTGIQFALVSDTAPLCEYLAPSDVFIDEFGGIPGVMWEPNPWGSTDIDIVSSGCQDNSSACLRVRNMNMGDGWHIYYPNPFPVDMFETLRISLKAVSGSGKVIIAPSMGSRCNETEVTVSEQWQTITIDVPASCTEFTEINGVTMSNRGTTMHLLIDNIQFE
ncbi:hypothetical protein KKF34_15045 [Myxococcota bacterium]|nr:hypothetical protein [Myxococcota bacterium]MBU1380475.1 hypothetical protein [Myxococcota bacterium]MBU1498193.1 hypothetical protein [Myxococcota bacterium]